MCFTNVFITVILCVTEEKFPFSIYVFKRTITFFESMNLDTASMEPQSKREKAKPIKDHMAYESTSGHNKDTWKQLDQTDPGEWTLESCWRRPIFHE